jgi:hypothetical protein
VSEPYTRDDVEVAVNAGADLVMEDLSLGDRDYDLINLVVNAIMVRLEDAEASLDDVIRENYGDSPEEVRGWWDW